MKEVIKSFHNKGFRCTVACSIHVMGYEWTPHYVVADPTLSAHKRSSSAADMSISSADKQEYRTSVDIPVPKSSILASSKNSSFVAPESPKKKVSFLHVNISDKDSIYSVAVPQTLQSVERQMKMAEHSRQLYGLHAKTRYSTFGRTRSSTDLSSFDKGLRSRSWLNLRWGRMINNWKKCQ